MSDRVAINVSAHIAHVTLTRADKMNALDPAMFEAICAAIDELNTLDDLRAVVVSGEGRGFCAGLDLSNFASDSEPMDLMPRTHGAANMPQQIAWGWRALPVPVIAAVHGVAIGGGLNIMSGADIRIIHPDTRCAVMEMRWGLVPDMAGYPLWRGNVRDDVLRKLVYTHAEFSGADACEMGFATEVAAEPLARAMTLAEEIAGKNPHAIRAAKRLSNALATSTDEELLLAESEEQTQIIGKPNQIEAVMSQMEGRPAAYPDSV
jgi:enoyl-CoA hydratase/carnithine racemase